MAQKRSTAAFYFFNYFYGWWVQVNILWVAQVPEFIHIPAVVVRSQQCSTFYRTLCVQSCTLQSGALSNTTLRAPAPPESDLTHDKLPAIPMQSWVLWVPNYSITTLQKVHQAIPYQHTISLTVGKFPCTNPLANIAATTELNVPPDNSNDRPWLPHPASGGNAAAAVGKKAWFLNSKYPCMWTHEKTTKVSKDKPSYPFVILELDTDAFLLSFSVYDSSIAGSG